MAKEEMTCSCQHHRIMPMTMGALVLLFGIFGLLKAMDTVSAEVFGWVWPILVILVGVGWLGKGLCKCC